MIKLSQISRISLSRILNSLFLNRSTLKHNGRRYVLFACPTIGGMARFLPSRYKFIQLYECRGTRLTVSRKRVKVY